MGKGMFRRNALRLVYALGFVGYTAYAYWYLTQFIPAFVQISGIPASAPPFQSLWVFFIPGYLIIAGPFAVLAVRPMWWGKLLMLMFLVGAPMAWLFSYATATFQPALREQADTAADFAYAFAALAIVQQIIDPTVWRPPSTWLSKDCPPPWPFGRPANPRAKRS